MNKNKIEFDWQPLTLKIPQSILTTPKKLQSTYRIDCYVPSLGKYIEIKGIFRDEINKIKWEWFHKEYPNSELWNKNKFKELGIRLYRPYMLRKMFKKGDKENG